MENRVVISQLYIENFKTIERALISFEDYDLTVLDGPNGFGKTTIFDSIELVLTGHIERIQKYKIAVTSRGYRDYLFAKDQSKPVIIKIVLKCINDQKTSIRIFARSIDPTSLRPTSKKPFEFDYELHELNYLDQPLNRETISSEEELEKIFNVRDFQERFRLYHYVEQEDSSFFLKKNEKERMEAISKLFNIQEEVVEKEKLESTRKLLRNHRREIGKQLENIKRFTRNEEQINVDMEEIPYKRLLPTTINKAWDQENLVSLDKNKRDSYLLELNQIILLKEQFEDFLKQSKNNSIGQIINNKDRVSGLIILGHFHKEYRELKLEFERKNQLKKYLSVLEEREFLSKFVDWNLIFDLFDLPIEKKLLLDRIDTIKTMDKTSNNLSSILKTLLAARENLKRQFTMFIDGHHDSEIGRFCPFCGNDWVTFEQLNEELDRKTIFLKRDLDENSSKVVLEIDKLYNEILHDIINLIKDYFSSDNVISDEFFQQLDKYHKLEIEVEKGKELVKKFGVNIEDFINKEKHFVMDLEEKTEQVLLILESQKESVNLEVKDLFSSLNKVYVNTFQQSDSVINNLKIEEIEQKKQYIDYQYFKQSSQFFIEEKKLNLKLEKIEALCEQLDNIIKVYNKKINEHRGKMISDLEIPFYIYSGKVIQNHQRGIGVFIKEDKNESEELTELKAINFVPPEETDHDIVHSFSSGQLSATVLSFTLALNKVYNRSGLNTILIDDPVQTMDEINMASFIELIRNDFSDRQIILSTHEDNISLYVRYKYSKFGLKAANFNVKEELYN